MSYSSALSNIEIDDLDLSGAIEAEFAEDLDPIDAPASPQTQIHKAVRLPGFDYSGLSSAVVKEAEAAATRIRDRLRESILTTGAELLDIKEKLGHGKFGKWLNFHFGWRERTAQNYMNAATAFASSPKIIDMLPASTIYKLAARSTPDELRREVTEDIAKGLRPTKSEVEKRIAETKAVVGSSTGAHLATDAVTEATSETLQVKPGDEPEDALDMPTDAAESDFPAGSSSSPTGEQIAARIVEFIKLRSGADFDKVRTAILTLDPAVLNKVLRES